MHENHRLFGNEPCKGSILFLQRSRDIYDETSYCVFDYGDAFNGDRRG